MSLTKKFVRKPFEVDAVQVTSENMQDVAKWCGGDVRTRKEQDENVRYIKVRVYRPLDERQSKAFVGDWVLYAGTGYKVYTTNAFENTFIEAEKVKEPAEAFKNANTIKAEQPSHVRVVPGQKKASGE